MLRNPLVDCGGMSLRLTEGDMYMAQAVGIRGPVTLDEAARNPFLRCGSRLERCHFDIEGPMPERDGKSSPPARAYISVSGRHGNYYRIVSNVAPK